MKRDPLGLESALWSELKTAYGLSASAVRDLLVESYRSGVTQEQLSEIVNEVQHQGDTSEAMYAVAPHLLALVHVSNELHVPLITAAGLMYASSQTVKAVPCPKALEPSWLECRRLGLKLVLNQLHRESDFEDFKYLLVALAGFSGHGRFGLIVDSFELFEDRFYHCSLEGPLDE